MNKKSKTEKIVEKGRIYVTSTYNNTLVTLTDNEGQPFLTGSCGMYGFSGTRKSTPYASTVTVQSTLQKALDENNMREASVYIKGIGPGRMAALKAIRASGVDIIKIMDITPIPHNGVRPPKMRKG
ncbi:30S ribosomal protein S11 [Candidatus Roizmanbacteria bacterium RIFCSPLOWO2_01_FULL_42_14]|uniref:Small ribosomal subunit protein uS11 n=4 Tax=Candidatus Roizmaniibacteriota TaxID=1752723 RepID=A0A1F7JV07_9BACT|nr:MAG: 30S ribosomal protein S11 [Candidatus Roizmanbacteria bacterium RIFCSPHIGHO2_02_FULL_43_11]OGK38616.1 MAG: 30S ribosomal protein S11 [Candidatus Roizmanbacteria bacterium RIFCSPHIGHO2_12_FULL_42_10]OGK52210.1 MAG: 30S ribosomal protein S11 [Candidatus Roizmanbacteria bacterium RIFCSPLOWO2_01_FULL_42_14]OGK59443.1 MAG: 30S ribosomal protein S11 [Candidatus Roizmanbacteria bacterium RIFCSPLOWO2_02_FULL_43_10]